MTHPLISSPKNGPAPIPVGRRLPPGTSVDRIIEALASLGGKVVREDATRARIELGSIPKARFWGLAFEKGRRNFPLTISIDASGERPSVEVALRDTKFLLLRLRPEFTLLDRRAQEIDTLLDAV